MDTTLGFFLWMPSMEYMLWVFVPCLLIGLWAQMRVKSAYKRASKINARSGRTGAQAAAEILLEAGVDNVAIEQTKGWLSDHYDPRSRTLRLSPDVFQGRSLAALGIAAHEVGHAIQHAHNYAPLTMRNALVPVASIGSSMSYIIIVAGVLLHMSGLLWLGVGLFAALVVFQLFELPCEFDASARAKQQLGAMSLVAAGEEERQVARVLNAAAMTYVAALVSSLITLAYYLFVLLGDD